VLLVATDFDGTLSPIVDDPDAAEPSPRARRALSTLAGQCHTRVAVISGRALRDLEHRLQLSEDDILLVGSHGSEFEPELAARLTDLQRDLLEKVHAAVESAATGLEGILTEHKDASSTLHYRQANRDVAAEALCRLHRSIQALPPPRPQIRRGKKVVELAVLHMHKGEAVARIRTEVGATAALYLGDDRTDEDVFRIMGTEDLSVKVGPGPTAARVRVDNTEEVADLLAYLADLRSQALRQREPCL
jgi:trehalose-phosphatase